MKKVIILLLFIVSIQSLQAVSKGLYGRFSGMDLYYISYPKCNEEQESKIFRYCLNRLWKDQDCSVINDYLLLSGKKKESIEIELGKNKTKIQRIEKEIDEIEKKLNEADDFIDRKKLEIDRKKLELKLKKLNASVVSSKNVLAQCVSNVFSSVNPLASQEDKDVQARLEKSFNALVKKANADLEQEFKDLKRAIDESNRKRIEPELFDE